VEQFQKEKDAVKAKVKENQQMMKEALQNQMEQHKKAKLEEKKHDLEYYEVIRRQKDQLAHEEKEKKDTIKRLIEEQKLVRDRQIEEHNRLKHQARKEKHQDHERILKVQEELLEKKNKEKEALK
jgi:hypothetical protein